MDLDRDASLAVRIRLMTVGPSGALPPAALVALARQQPPAVLAVWLVEHSGLSDAAWAVLQEEFQHAPARAVTPPHPPPPWIQRLVRRSPLLAGVALQHWPGLRLALHTAPGQPARLILASSVGHAAWPAAGLLLTVRGLPLPADGPPPPGVWPEELIDATVPDVLAAAFWAAAAPTGWAGVLIGRRHPAATEFLPTLFLTTRLEYQAPVS
jgi:hypothetical protein